MSRLDNQLVNDAVDKILAYSRGETVAGVKGKQRGFVETIDLQVRPTRGLGPLAHAFRRDPPLVATSLRHGARPGRPPGRRPNDPELSL
jgi:hypothetical protein